MITVSVFYQGKARTDSRENPARLEEFLTRSEQDLVAVREMVIVDSEGCRRSLYDMILQDCTVTIRPKDLSIQDRLEAIKGQAISVNWECSPTPDFNGPLTWWEEHNVWFVNGLTFGADQVKTIKGFRIVLTSPECEYSNPVGYNSTKQAEDRLSRNQRFWIPELKVVIEAQSRCDALRLMYSWVGRMVVSAKELDGSVGVSCDTLLSESDGRLVVSGVVEVISDRDVLEKLRDKRILQDKIFDRMALACKVCGSVPTEDGELIHGRACDNLVEYMKTGDR